MSLARAQTLTSQSGYTRTNHGATILFKVIYIMFLWFCITVSHLPLCHPFKSKTKTSCDQVTRVICMSCLQYLFNLHFDCLHGLSLSFAIGQSDYSGFHFTTLSCKLLKITRQLNELHNVQCPPED